MFGMKLMFKIDLIVWKYDIDNSVYEKICESLK